MNVQDNLREQYRTYTTEYLLGLVAQPDSLTEAALEQITSELNERKLEYGKHEKSVIANDKIKLTSVQKSDITEDEVNRRSRSWAVYPLHLFGGLLVSLPFFLRSGISYNELQNSFISTTLLIGALIAWKCGVVISISIVMIIYRRYPKPWLRIIGLIPAYVLAYLIFNILQIILTSSRMPVDFHIVELVFLISVSYSISYPSKPRNLSALMLASGRGDIEKMKNTLLKGNEVNQKDSLGGTALHYAVLNRHTAAVVWLLENGADTSACSNKGLTPATLARKKGFDEIEKLLTLHVDYR